MKNFTKILPAIFLVLMGISLVSCSDDKNEPIDFNKLPLVSQDFINTYFKDVDIVSILYNNDKDVQEYDVELGNGFELTFNIQGDWIDIEAPEGQTIPAGIAPEPIENYISVNYPEQGINEISKNKNGYDVDLTDGTDLLFNLQGEFQGTDK